MQLERRHNELCRSPLSAAQQEAPTGGPALCWCIIPAALGLAEGCNVELMPHGVYALEWVAYRCSSTPVCLLGWRQVWAKPGLQQ